LDMTVSTSWLAPETGARLGPTRTTLVAGALMLAADDASRRTVQQGVPPAWRNVTSQPQRTRFEGHDPVEWWGTRDGFVVDGVTVLSVSPTSVRLEVRGVTSETRGRIYAPKPGGPREIWVDGPLGSACLREVPRFADPADALASGSLLAPMPGSVVRVPVQDGASVQAGDTVLVLEAMKMQHTICAPTDGVVSDLVAVGAQVAAGDVLAVVVSTSSTSGTENP
ncbi:MAG: acetyl/propionyl-CoA carboxylase subunit alpha, partial [Marmoricola sp.]|nr:acetyl/propionyl-CoA carboxylase subunit alpha [Marmoricola sp.]